MTFEHAVLKKLDDLDESLCARLERMEKRIERIEVDLHRRVDKLQLEVDEIWPRIGSLTAELASARAEMAIRDQRYLDRFQEIHRRLEGVERRLDGMEGVSDSQQLRALSDTKAELALARDEVRQLERDITSRAHDWRKSIALAALATLLSIIGTLLVRGL